MAVTLGALAVRYGCELRGDPGIVVERVATLAGARPGTLTFLANPHYRPQLAATQASAVVLAAEDAELCPVACLVSENPYLAYARLAGALRPARSSLQTAGSGRTARSSRGPVSGREPSSARASTLERTLRLAREA